MSERKSWLKMELLKELFNESILLIVLSDVVMLVMSWDVLCLVGVVV